MESFINLSERRVRGMEFWDRQDFVSCQLPKFSPRFPWGYKYSKAVPTFPSEVEGHKLSKGRGSVTKRRRWAQALHYCSCFPANAFHMQIVHDAIIQFSASPPRLPQSIYFMGVTLLLPWWHLGCPRAAMNIWGLQRAIPCEHTGEVLQSSCSVQCGLSSGSWAPWIRTFLWLPSLPSTLASMLQTLIQLSMRNWTNA